jgi:hypothetical protein
MASRGVPGHPPRDYRGLSMLIVNVQEVLDVRDQAYHVFPASSGTIPAQTVRPNGATRHASSRNARSTT